jgi:hypothetical protein
MKSVGKIFASIGIVGLVITLGMNLVALLGFKKAAAVFASPGWWSSWFSCYVVWAVFAISALGLLLTKGRDGPVATKSD